MSQGEPFAGMEPGVKTVIESDLDGRIAKLVKEVHAMFDIVLADFDSMFIVRERPNIHKDRLRGAMRDLVHKADATQNGPMEEHLAKAISESASS